MSDHNARQTVSHQGVFRQLFVSVLMFVVLYVLCLVPWPGFNQVYGRYFQAFGNGLFSRDDSPRYVHFEPSDDSRFAIGVKIMLANRDQVDANGRLPAKVLGLEARGVGWIPTALISALIVASPVPWKRRAWALVFGLLLIHLFILLSVACYLWNQSTDLGLLSLSPFWKTMTESLEETLITQFGASFVVPVVLWLFLTFRLEDFRAFTTRPQMICPPQAARGEAPHRVGQRE